MTPMVLLLLFEDREHWLVVNDHADVRILLERGYKIPRVVTMWEPMRGEMHLLGPI